MIRDGILSSQAIDALSADAERLFYRLLVVADDYGRFEADPRLLVAKCFPLKIHVLTVETVEALYVELEKAELVYSYTVGLYRYGVMSKWGKLRYYSHSKLPEPPETLTIKLEEHGCLINSYGGESESSLSIRTYFVLDQSNGIVKIGKTGQYETRLSTIQTSQGIKITPLGWIAGDSEKKWHRNFKHLRSLGEWFIVTDELATAIENAGLQEPYEDFCGALRGAAGRNRGKGLGMGVGKGKGEEGGGRSTAKPANQSEFLVTLKNDPTYLGIDIDRELGKCSNWMKVNQTGKVLTQARFINWLNRAERPLTVVGGSPRKGLFTR